MKIYEPRYSEVLEELTYALEIFTEDEGNAEGADKERAALAALKARAEFGPEIRKVVIEELLNNESKSEGYEDSAPYIHKINEILIDLKAWEEISVEELARRQVMGRGGKRRAFPTINGKRYEWRG